MCDYRELAAKQYKSILVMNDARFSGTFCETTLLFTIHQCIKNNLLYMYCKYIAVPNIDISIKDIVKALLSSKCKTQCVYDVLRYIDVFSEWDESVLLVKYETALSKTVTPILKVCEELCKYVANM